MNRFYAFTSIPFRHRRAFALAALLTLLIALHLSAAAQSATATLSGSVTDQAGAVVAGAAVKAVNTATNLERKTKTNSEGFFTLPLLPPGNYTILCERDGFAAINKRDVILNVGDQRSLLIQLRVGGVAAQVTVTDEASLLNESPSVGTVINRQFVENLPLNGRSFLTLLEQRQFSLTERLKLQFRAELFNAFNNPNFGNPSGNLLSGFFGTSTQMLNRSLGEGGVAGGFSPIYQIGGPRSSQLALRLQF